MLYTNTKISVICCLTYLLIATEQGITYLQHCVQCFDFSHPQWQKTKIDLYRPPTKLRKCNVFSRVCLFACLSSPQSVPCEHYPWCNGPYSPTLCSTDEYLTLNGMKGHQESFPVVCVPATLFSYMCQWPATRCQDQGVLKWTSLNGV